ILSACGPAATEAPPVETEEPAAPPAEPTEAPAEPTAEPTPEGPPMDPQTAAVASDPVTNHGYSTTELPTIDPALGEDVVSINYIENLFVHLTNVDLETTEIVPEAATSWEISEDGLTYTFTLRNDIPWVKYDGTGNVVQEADADGHARYVTAQDFEYGIKRACDPNLGSYYSGVIAPQIVGCGEVFNAEDPENIPDELFDAIGVTALDDQTLEINLAFPASYFLSMTPMWTLAATPQWAIEEHGDQWIDAGNIVTNGRYVLAGWDRGVSREVLRNPLMPADMAGSGNVDRLITNVVPDTNTGYALWLNNEVETSGIPDEELEAHLAEFGDETIQVPDLAVFYISFRMTKPPFDDVHVRRAFSAAFDRETFITEVRQGQGLAMTHFAPPGIFGAPPIDEIGIGYDPDFARAEMEAAGYPNCEGFPQVTLLGYSGQSTLNWIEFAQANWSEVLGCSADLIQVEQQQFSDLLATTDASVPDEEAPHMWTLGWGPDYGDENNWVGDVLWCENLTRSKRECNEIDDLIVEAREESDPNRRIELYAQIEEMFFGPEGEVPFFPIFVRIAYVAEHSWFERTPALFGGEQWYNYNIDVEAQAAARGE
ncbi:MAG TPA: peptide ABC transporter substrate-binding protein, partial [Anaerolineales bacterium]|nr:peptide ABC transporter substrate-binding protein [Anaerolineales bacterium]